MFAVKAVPPQEAVYRNGLPGVYTDPGCIHSKKTFMVTGFKALGAGNE